MRALVLDFEATCDDVSRPDPQEIIEFPTVLLDLDSGEVIDTFERFVRPVHGAITPFCTGLTSITPADVAGAETFHEVLLAHQAWMDGHALTPDNALMVTCGDWDLNRMLPHQLRTSEVAYLHPLYRRWLNIKVMFKAHHPGVQAGMAGMLKTCGLELIGRHHRGIDDCHNIARLLVHLHASGGQLEASTVLPMKRFPPVRVRVEHEGVVRSGLLAHRALHTFKGLAGKLFKTKLKHFTLDGHTVDDAMLLELDHDRTLVARGDDPGPLAR
ncbi:MAG: ERI1 exoribonuclease 3 [Myxococcota bacterium]|jgi:ERI1 exoribonuclease 3